MASLRRVFGALGQFGEDVVEGIDEVNLGTLSIDGAQKVSQDKNQFYLVPTDVTIIRDYDFDPSDPNHATQNGGAVEFINGEYEATTDAQADSRATLSTGAIGEYRSGTIASAGFYIRHEDELIAGEQVEGGYFFPDGDNGLKLRKTPDGLDFVVRAAGVDTTFSRYNDEWDTVGPVDVTNENGDDVGRFIGIDALDGSGPSEIDLEEIDDGELLSGGTIWIIEFTWYGGGAILLSRVSLLDDGRQRPVPVLAYKVENRVSFPQPNQPITLDIQSEREQTLFAAGRQFSYRGEFNIRQRKTEHITPSDLTISDSEYEILAAFKRKSTAQNVVLGLGDLSFNSDQPLSIHARIAPTFTGSPTVREASDTRSQDAAVEFDSISGNGGLVGTAGVDTTTDDDGNTVLSGAKFGGSIEGTEAGPFGLGPAATSAEEGGFKFPIPREEWIVIMAQSVGGGPATVRPSINVLEAR